MDEERRNTKRLAELDEMFVLLRAKEALLIKLAEVYSNYKQELINTQINQAEIGKL